VPRVRGARFVPSIPRVDRLRVSVPREAAAAPAMFGGAKKKEGSEES